MTCKSGALTLDGSKSSNMKTTSSSTSPKILYLMCPKPRILKDKLFKYMEITVERTKSGMFYILTRLIKLKPKDSMKNSVSISIDLSIWSHSFHSTELLSALVLTTLPSRDGERMSHNNNSTLMRFQRPSDPKHGRTMVCKSNQPVDQQTSDSHLLSNQDGGNCSDTKDNSLSMIKERSLKSQKDLITRTKTSWSTTRMVKYTSNGRSSMLMSIRESQSRVNSMRNSVFMSKEISTLFQQ
jgi:hypothetical protein